MDSSDDRWPALKAKASSTKRIVEQLRDELKLPACSMTILLGVGAAGELKVSIIASLEPDEVRRLVRCALDLGVVP